MANTRQHPILDYLRRVLGDPAAAGVSDADLLRRFVDQRDEAAFELLLWRHAAMVLHVCRQVISDEQAAEDAFQATFLVFVRKGASISRREALGSWLYRVAYRIALKARARVKTRTATPEELDRLAAPAEADTADGRELRQIICEEVNRLPADYRAAVVACFFEGKTHEEAAKQLGWPRGTVAGRLARARELLHRRLLRRGVTLTLSALLTALAARTAQAALTGLVDSVIHTARLVAAGQAAAAAVSPPVAALAEGVLQAMYWTRVKIVMGVVMLAGLGGIGTTFWVASPKPAESRKEPSQRADTARRGDKAEASKEEDKLTRARTQSRLNLRKLVVAMSEHSDTNKGYMPPAALINKDGKAVLSWRVLLLPYLGERELYEQFKLSEPWDGPNNKKLLSRMPAVYAPPSIKTPQPFSTFYQVFVSPKPKDGRKATEKGGTEIQAAFVHGEPQLYPSHIVDGTANTILIVEARQAVPWTKPEDLPYTADARMPELGGLFPGIFHAAFADGHVETLTKKFDPNALRTVITGNGGELMDFAKFQSHSAAVDWQRKNGNLREDLEDARERLRLLHEERDALKQQSAAAKSKQEAESRLDELKQENARLQKELEKMSEQIQSVNAGILQRLQKSTKKTP